MFAEIPTLRPTTGGWGGSNKWVSGKQNSQISHFVEIVFQFFHFTLSVETGK